MLDISQRVTCIVVTSEDFEELVTFRIAAMRDSLERVGRFDPVCARERLAKSFYPEHTRFILLDGTKVGFYTFRPMESYYQLDHFYVHPSYQSQGIGSYILHQLLACSDSFRLPVQLTALRNSEANLFYQRYGFVKTTEDEWDIHYIRPATESDQVSC